MQNITYKQQLELTVKTSKIIHEMQALRKSISFATDNDELWYIRWNKGLENIQKALDEIERYKKELEDLKFPVDYDFKDVKIKG